MIWFNVGVGEQMGLQIGSLVEAPVADRTFVRGLFHVQDLMNGQSARLAEPFTTLQALEWLFLRVDVPDEEKKDGEGVFSGRVLIGNIYTTF